MGEGFLNHNSKLIIFVLLSFKLLSGIDAHASTREFDFFNKGYEYYLSYQPEKAVEEFKAFLKEFPGSSVKDAVMFWLGKSSIQLKNFEEAKKSFSNVSREFPGSPYIKYVKRELEILDKALSEDKLAGDEKKAEPIQPYGKGRDEKEDYATDSSYVLTRLDIKDVLWRRGNVSEDIENEKVLFEGAKKANISLDEVKYEELVLKYGFNSQQAGYLRKYLTICEFLDKKLKDVSEERIVESLVANYGEGDKYRKIVISPEIQKEAKNGMPFEDIQKLYPDLLKVVITGYAEVEADIREKIRYLQNDEVGVIWSEEGYMVLKPVLKKLSYKPFEEAGPGIRNKIEGFISEWLVELKRTGK